MKNETEQLLHYIESNIARTLADCTTCGKCFDACPMTKYSDKLESKSGSEESVVLQDACAAPR